MCFNTKGVFVWGFYIYVFFLQVSFSFLEEILLLERGELMVHGSRVGEEYCERQRDVRVMIL